MATLAEVVTLTEERCPGGAALPGVATTSKYVAAALARLNDVAPRTVQQQITGDGTQEYPLGEDYTEDAAIQRVRFVPGADFNQAADWVQSEDYEVEFGRSQVVAEAVGTGDGSTTTFALANPRAVDELAAVTIDGDAVAVEDFEIRSGPGGSLIEFAAAPGDTLAIVATYYVFGPQIRILSTTPGASDLVVVEYSAAHRLTDEGTTIAAADLPFLADLAAALKLEAAAVACLSVTPQDTEEDLADYNKGDRSDALLRIARILKARFDGHYGIGTGADTPEAPSSIAFADVDVPPSSSTWYRHTHPRREF